MSFPACPQCQSSLAYPDGDMLICPECGHEWNPAGGDEAADATPVWKDAVGNVLQDGDTVTLVKDLRLKGSSTVIKVGTKARNIRRVEGDHDVDCKIDGMGAMQLKSEFVRKVS